MKRTLQLMGIIEREDDGYVALCPELDIASQGNTVEEARHNLIEALELFFETADPNEVESRLHVRFLKLTDLRLGYCKSNSCQPSG